MSTNTEDEALAVSAAYGRISEAISAEMAALEGMDISWERFGQVRQVLKNLSDTLHKERTEMLEAEL